MTEVTPQVVDPLRLSACIECGYSIDALEGERHRLRIGKHPNWFGLAPRLTVDAEVQCTRDQAAALRARIDGWRANADAATQTGGFPVVQKS